MGMFDTYFPEPPIACPKCLHAVEAWQGYVHLVRLCWRDSCAPPLPLTRAFDDLAAFAAERETT